jgi:hypothetical protein
MEGRRIAPRAVQTLSSLQTGVTHFHCIHI